MKKARNATKKVKAVSKSAKHTSSESRPKKRAAVKSSNISQSKSMSTEVGTAADIERELRKYIRPDKAEFMPKFMQSYPGGYGEGDRFLGVMVPDLRRTAKMFADLRLQELSKLLRSRWHECRLTGIYLLVLQFERAQRLVERGKPADPSPAALVQFYLDHLDGVNNWDLVDASSHKILGPWILQNPKEIKILRQLAGSGQLWRERVAVISTFAFIRNQEFGETLKLAKKFLNHPHDLMHKAVGWMLREMGKRDVEVLRAFLLEHADRMPRTMLRYSIEKLSQAERTRWLARDS